MHRLVTTEQAAYVRSLLKTIERFNEITDVAVDVNMEKDEHSWAVVCIAGKPEYVKFIPLSKNDTRSVIDFLKRFQYSKHIVDNPIRFRSMLNDYFL